MEGKCSCFEMRFGLPLLLDGSGSGRDYIVVHSRMSRVFMFEGLTAPSSDESTKKTHDFDLYGLQEISDSGSYRAGREVTFPSQFIATPSQATFPVILIALLFHRVSPSLSFLHSPAALLSRRLQLLDLLHDLPTIPDPRAEEPSFARSAASTPETPSIGRLSRLL